MRPQEDQELLNVIKATGEIYGKQVSVAAAGMFLADLSGYRPDQIRSALQRCRRELRSFPTVADVVARIDDGRPGVEEAWAIAPKDEDATVVWTDEVAEAFGVCRDLIRAGDVIAARMAFKEHYQRAVAEARNSLRAVRWTVSLGLDRHSRDSALLEAIGKRRLTLEQALEVSPGLKSEHAPARALPGAEELIGLSQVIDKLEWKNGGESHEK